MISLDKKQITEVVSGFQIPVKPEILTNIQNLMAEEEPDIAKIAELIASDIGMSSAILKIINSPFYGMNRRISEIKQAVMMLGLTTINSLLTALTLKASFKGNASISLERFWDDAMDIASAMSFIGQQVKNQIPVDELYSLGLFHNCGIAVLAIKYPDYKEILMKANNQQVNSIALEEKAYQTNHAVLGYYVASSWNLPPDLCHLILNHHDFLSIFNETDEKQQLSMAVLKAAENITEKAKRHQNSTDWQDIKAHVLDILGLSEVDFSDLEDDYFELYNSCEP